MTIRPRSRWRLFRPRLPRALPAPAAEFTFTVTFAGEVEGGFRVAYAANDGTATLAGSDYVDNDGSLTFNGTSGEVRQITVRANADATVEADETFQVVLGALSEIDPAVAASIQFAGSPLTATILNDDKAVLTLTGPAPAEEGTGSTTTPVVFQVALSAPVQGGFQLAFTTDDGTAKAIDGDYVDNDGQLVFNGTANETRAITVQVQSDTVLERDENLAVTLRNVLGIDPSMADDITFAVSSVSATILNDDDTTLTLSQPAAIAEGTGGEFTELPFTVTLAAAVQGGLRVTYTTDDGTATVADGDYEDNDGALTFAGLAGETKTITVRIRHDNRVEREESFSVCLGAVTRPDETLLDGVVIVGSPAEVRILNDDRPRLALAAGATSLTEGTGTGNTPYTFTVTLLDAVPDEDGFDVAYTTNDGSATVAAGDYTDNDGVLRFAGTAGEAKTITVLVTRDDIVEADESFSVALGQISGMVDGISAIVQNSPAAGQIEDDDAATLTLAAESAAKAEGTGDSTTDFTFVVSLSHPSAGRPQPRLHDGGRHRQGGGRRLSGQRRFDRIRRNGRRNAFDHCPRES